eukprot:411185-Pleurochrysis_carterae.AAC.1
MSSHLTLALHWRSLPLRGPCQPAISKAYPTGCSLCWDGLGTYKNRLANVVTSAIRAYYGSVSTRDAVAADESAADRRADAQIDRSSS